MKIYVYYHITLINNWEDIVKEQCTRIIFSGLYEKLEQIKCYAIDPKCCETERCRSLLKTFGKKFSLEDVCNKGNEWFTLNIYNTVWRMMIEFFISIPKELRDITLRYSQ